MYSRVSNTSNYVLGGIVAFVLAIVLIGGCVSYAKTSTVAIHVTGKESVSTHDGHEYRVYTTGATYKVGDSIVHPRFNSADVYGRILVNHDYTCTVYGWRIPILSGFKNILHCEEKQQ